MQKVKATLSILFLLTMPALGSNQKPDRDDGSMFLGRHYAFILKEPNGWVLDNSAAKSQGLQAVLYQERSSWKDAVAVMYVRVIYKDENAATREQVIKEDISDFLKQNVLSKVSESPVLSTRDKKEALVKEFYDASNKNYESVAIIDEPKVVVILALSSRNKEAFDKSRPAFKALVGSYFFARELVDR
jgi:hypothetical protein